jgi:hypothetical protein
MIPKNGYRFSGKIMLKQQAKAKCQFNPKSFCFSGIIAGAVVSREFRP